MHVPKRSWWALACRLIITIQVFFCCYLAIWHFPFLNSLFQTRRGFGKSQEGTAKSQTRSQHIYRHMRARVLSYFMITNIATSHMIDETPLVKNITSIFFYQLGGYWSLLEMPDDLLFVSRTDMVFMVYFLFTLQVSGLKMMKPTLIWVTIELCDVQCWSLNYHATHLILVESLYFDFLM